MWDNLRRKKQEFQKKFADNYDISSLLDLEKYKKIKTLSEFISGIKNKKLDKENIDKYLFDSRQIKYKHNKNNKYKHIFSYNIYIIFRN